VRRAVATVAQLLGNTPAVCRRCYVHPAIVEGYLDGVVLKEATTAVAGLKPEEAAVAAFLGARMHGTVARAA
jgi:DNA topoisomerase-1